MPRHSRPERTGFGPQLAALRKAAGYTQQELAEEIGVSRRVIAYYEAESQHPPAALLVDLARALNVSTDILLGVAETPRRTTKASSRLERRLKRIETLEPRARRQLVQLIDTFIEAEEIKKRASSV